MIRQPERNYRLTDEEYDALNYILDMEARHGNADAAYICAKLYKQHTYNPSDEPIKYVPGYVLLPERRKLKNVESEQHIAELQEALDDKLTEKE